MQCLVFFFNIYGRFGEVGFVSRSWAICHSLGVYCIYMLAFLPDSGEMCKLRANSGWLMLMLTFLSAAGWS